MMLESDVEDAKTSASASPKDTKGDDRIAELEKKVADQSK